MKRIAYGIIALLITATSLKVSAQSEESRQVSGFTGVASAGPFDVHIKINGTESLKISANESIINEIETVVEDGTLKIKFKKDHNWRHENYHGSIDIYVTAKSLSALANAGSGSIAVNEGTVSGEAVDIMLSGSGDIRSDVKAANLHATISGSGSIKLSGTADEAKITISGSGEMQAKNLKTGSASVMIAGSGNAYFNAEKTVSAHIVGSGNVIYSGDATIAESRTVGSGRISKE